MKKSTYLVLLVLLASVIAAGCSSTENTKTADAPKEATTEAVKETPIPAEAPKEIVSTSFSDFKPYLDSSATSLQKSSFFDEHFKDKYVTWSGTVASVSQTMGSYKVQVKHSDKSLISDVIVTMRDDQKDKLLTLKEGDPIKYTAKLTRYGDILGLSADDGVIES
jgi:hypothetical protein